MEVVFEALKSTPAVAAMLVMVIFFIRHLGARDKAFLEHLAKRDEVLKDIGNQYHSVQKEATAVMKENILVLGKVSEAVRTLDKNQQNGSGRV